ncbi:unnamed protein product [Caenorhabditis brenneri]
MSSTSSRKREGEELSTEPELKHADETQSTHDVVIVVGGPKFNCTKKDLANHSQYFRSMFFSNFEENKKQEVELKTAHPEGFQFQLFLDAMEGLDTITDDNVQDAMVVAAFLESSTLEEKCLDHLAVKSNFTLAEQIELAEVLDSSKLLEHAFSRIKLFEEQKMVVESYST